MSPLDIALILLFLVVVSFAAGYFVGGTKAANDITATARKGRR